jgi:cytochrome c-type biogenesis protein CcmH/NrfF
VFIENRIRKGEDANTIVSKMLNGFGEDVMSDPIVKKFMDSGNTYMANKIVVGFGPNILAEPDATSINVTIGIFAFLGLSLIGIYFYSRKSKAPDKSPSTNSLPNKYLKEL